MGILPGALTRRTERSENSTEGPEVRQLRVGSAIAWTTVLVTVVGSVAGVAAADESSTPSRREVAQSRVAVEEKAHDVASVRARLVLANQRLQVSAVEAARAAEAFNGARWAVREARAAARVAERRSAAAGTDVERQREAYSGALVTSYVVAPSLTALSAMAQSDGISTVIDQVTTLHNAEDALDSRYDVFRASATVADVSAAQALEARDAATRAQTRARQARDAARQAAAAASHEASSIAAEKADLIVQLADLEQISVELAQTRQSALEEQAAAAAAAAAERDQQEKSVQAQSAGNTSSDQSGNGGGASQGGSPAPAPQPTPTPQPTPSPAPPAPAAGAQGAIDFARAQLGEPYRWGAAGPDAWDCSGLTMGAWRAGGRALPHYSVAQYEQSTPVSAGDLRAGDLVFWGSSNDSSSIYHVALYIGGGQIIHAPRTGRPVVQESMYYWTPPNFYARP